MVAIYKNWPRVIAYRLNFKPEAMEVKLRDGARFLVRDRREELSDAYVINESFLYGIHDNILPYLKNARIGIDAGAHIGTFSIFAARRSPAKIFAVEPTEKNLRVLRENIKLNDLNGRVVPVRVALAGKSGEIDLFVPQNGGLATTTAGHLENYGAAEGGVSSSKIRALTLADFFKENRIDFCDFIKMDVEGAEYDIFYNTPEEIFKRIGIMSIECHGDGDINQLMKFISARGFEVSRPTMEFGEIFCKRIA
jgi:FkbM family methyltransferase